MGGALVLLATGAFVGTQAADADGSPSPFPSDLTDLRTQLDSLGAQAYADLESQPSTFLLPPDQAVLWRQSWDRMRACALDHGYAGVPEVLPTYGDGSTPAPVIEASLPGATDVIAACPFVPEGMDLAGLTAAVRADAQARAGDSGH